MLRTAQEQRTIAKL